MATKAVHYAPQNLRSITPHVCVPNGLQAIEFYKKAFGAEVLSHAPGPAPGSTIHCELRIGDSVVMLADQMDMGPLRTPAQLGASTVSLTLFVPDADAVFAQAARAGATVVMPLQDMFWGDRWGTLKDPFGHVWSIGTHKEDVPPDEMEKRTRQFFAEMAKMSATTAKK
jgi:uncharacterized glyoxalase superfamily protein PhnB